jgi:transposase
MLKDGSVLNLLELHAEGKSIREIARETAFSGNTVRSYLRHEGTPERAQSAYSGPKQPLIPVNHSHPFR